MSACVDMPGFTGNRCAPPAAGAAAALPLPSLLAMWASEFLPEDCPRSVDSRARALFQTPGPCACRGERIGPRSMASLRGLPPDSLRGEVVCASPRLFPGSASWAVAPATSRSRRIAPVAAHDAASAACGRLDLRLAPASAHRRRGAFSLFHPAPAASLVPPPAAGAGQRGAAG